MPRPRTLLVKNAAVLVTMDAERRELRDAGLFVRDGRIEHVGPTDELPATADEVLDLAGHIVLPGLVNTHHHLFQMPTRVVPGSTTGGVGPWLSVLYPVWARLTAEVLALPRVSVLPNWCSPAARRRSISYTCFPTTAGSTTRSIAHAKSAFGSTRDAAA